MYIYITVYFVLKKWRGKKCISNGVGRITVASKSEISEEGRRIKNKKTNQRLICHPSRSSSHHEYSNWGKVITLSDIIFE